MTIFFIICLSILSAVMYRMGGSGNYDRWIRHAGCSACVVIALGILIGWSWWLILVFGLQFGALTTYFKKKGTDAHWWNWLLVGFAWSIVILPVVISSHIWVGFFCRSLILTALVCIWSVYEGNAVREELGRGFLLVGTIPILLIG